jgi:hypothetical protein
MSGDAAARLRRWRRDLRQIQEGLREVCQLPQAVLGSEALPALTVCVLRSTCGVLVTAPSSPRDAQSAVSG